MYSFRVTLLVGSGVHMRENDTVQHEVHNLSLCPPAYFAVAVLLESLLCLHCVQEPVSAKLETF